MDLAEHADIPLPLPYSHLYEIKHSPISGRGVFATRLLQDKTILLQTKPDYVKSKSIQSPETVSYGQETAKTHSVKAQSPISYTILREYRKEVCGDCFLYDRGREWKVKFAPADSITECARSTSGATQARPAGIVFCSETCKSAWLARYGSIGVEAFIALEGAVRKHAKRGGSQFPKTQKNETRSTDAQALRDESAELYQTKLYSETSNHEEDDRSSNKTTEAQDLSEIDSIRSMWREAARRAAKIAEARLTAQPSKAQRRLLRTSSEPDEIDGDLCYYLLTGTLSAYLSAMAMVTENISDRLVKDNASEIQQPGTCNDYINGEDSTAAEPQSESRPTTNQANNATQRENQSSHSPTPSSHSLKELLPSLLALTPDLACYAHPSSTPTLYIKSYTLLHAILPSPLTAYLTPNLAHELNSRASHNAFSIRPSEQSDGTQSGEFTGWGVWPSASFFNHSCAPNVGKIRKGRDWEFFFILTDRTNRESGDHDWAPDSNEGKGTRSSQVELCITYLGGEERDLDVRQRRQRLREGWGFECMCVRCVEESKPESKSTLRPHAS